MGGSGTKLVIAMGLIAVAAGVGNWFYRTAATGWSAEFWGQPGAQILTDPQTVRLLKLLPREVAEQQGSPALSSWPEELVVVSSRDVTKVRGLAHLRHALVQDSHYDWSPTAQGGQAPWRVGLEFAGRTGQVTAVFSEDWLRVGRLDEASDSIRAVACPAMAEELERYFSASGILDTAQPAGAASTTGKSGL